MEGDAGNIANALLYLAWDVIPIKHDCKVILGMNLDNIGYTYLYADCVHDFCFV